MSLLLEALKKAEKAKEEAKRQAESDAAPDGVAAQGASDRHVVTRDELPDISQPLEIASDELAAAAQRSAERPPLAIELAPEPPPRRPPPAAEPRPASAPPPKAAAKNLFEAKFKEPNPKLPFYITMGILGTIAVGTVIYFWLQLRPNPPLVNPNPVRPANERPVDPATLPRPAPPAGDSRPGAAVQIPGLPPTAPPAPAPAPAATGAVSKPSPPVSQTTPAAQPATPAGATRATAAAAQTRAPQAPVAEGPRAAARSREQAPATIARPAPAIHPRLQQAYSAYNQGDFAAARSAYQETLRDEPANRDALLGMAAVEMRAGRFDAADGYYARLLRADPRDSDALAGRLALRTEQADPVQAETRLKSLLATDPDAHVLNFTLGNQFAQQSRWAEAQQYYFRAFAADPENPDYAYNLAVSLDQLRQTRLALDHYRRAIALAQTRSANFDQALARNRVQALTPANR